MPRHAGQRFAVIAVVFHELAGLFDGIPFDAIDAGDGIDVHVGEHVVQAVAKFVEKGGDFLMGEAGFAVAHGRGEVADEVGDGQL